MKNRNKVMQVLAVVFVIIASVSLNSIYAASGKIVNGSAAGNIFESTGSGSEIDHTSCTYAIDDEPAWCIEAGIPVKQGEGYNHTRVIDDGGVMSWLMYHSNQKGGPIDNQIIQAAIWDLTGHPLRQVSGDRDFLADVRSAEQQARDEIASISAPSATISVEGGNYNFRYDRGRNAYVTNVIRVDNGTASVDSTFGAYMEPANGGFIIVVPATNVTSDCTININATGTASAETYGPAKVWEKEASQTLVTPSKGTVTGGGASAGFNLIAVGDLEVVKKDEHDIKIKGAVFRVTGGPDNINQLITTRDDGTAELLEIRIGKYHVEEVEVPPTLVLNERDFEITVTSGARATYTVVNEYARGALNIVKEDVFKKLGKKNYGDGNFAGIVVQLRAAEDIYEGKTKVLNANEVIAERTLRIDGTTDEVRNFTRSDGKEFDGLPIGKYYWIEIKTNEAYLLPTDATVEEAKKEKYETQVTFRDINTHNIPVTSITLKDQEVYTEVEVYKMDNQNINGQNPTDENPAEGALLRLTLKSNYNYDKNNGEGKSKGGPYDESHDVYYARVDKFGKARFENIEFKDFDYASTGISDKYQIPYGEYVLDEVETSYNGQSYFYGIQDELIKAEDNMTRYCPIVMDEPIPVFLEVIKKDADSDDLNGVVHETVPLAGAKFKIWDCQANEGAGGWITQKIANSNKETDEFVTNDEGKFITPRTLFAGKYVIYETEAPVGYCINEEYRLPTDSNGKVIESQLGDETYGGKEINIENVAVVVTDAEEYPEGEGILDYDFIQENLKYTYTVADFTTRGNIEIYKKGEMFSSISSETSDKYVSDGYKDTLTEYTPEYAYQNLSGCKFEVWPVEDVKTVDGRIKEKAGTKHYIETGSNGYGICRKADGSEDLLFCDPINGTEYMVHEYECPAGFELCEDFTVKVTAGDQYTRTDVVKATIQDKYIPIELKLDKDFVKTNEQGVLYRNNKKPLIEKAVAIFGIYSYDDITATNGQEIPKDTLIQTLRVVEGEGYVDTYKLPDGKYYIEELYTKEPYTIIDKDTKEPHRYDFTVMHKKGEYDQQEVLVEAINNFPTGDLLVVKVSKTDVVQAAGLTLKTDEAGYAEIGDFLEAYSAEKTLQILEGSLTPTSAINEVLRQFETLNSYTLRTPAKYAVYVDKDCKIPLERSYDNGVTYEPVYLDAEKDEVSGLYNGVYTALGIPEGEYFVKELEAPVYVDKLGIVREYQVESNPIQIDIIDSTMLTDTEDNAIFRVFSDMAAITQIRKTDIFTGEEVPNCLFTITDEDDNELLRFVTNNEGIAEIPTDIFEDGEKYYFTEIAAPQFPYYDGDELYELNTDPHEFVAHVTEDGIWKMTDIDEDGNEIVYEKVEIQNYRVKTNVEFQKLDMMDSTPIPNCKFRLESKETDFVVEGVTDENGVYIFKDINYGDYIYTEIEAPEGYVIDTTPHEFTLDSKGTKIVVYNEKMIDVPDTGDIAVIAIVCIAVVCVAGIVFVVVKNKKTKSSK